MQTDKLVGYRKRDYPQLPGGDTKYINSELRNIQNAISSTQEILKDIEAAGTVASKAGAPAASDVADGTWQVIHDTTNNTVGLYANIGGTLFKVMLA